MSPVIHVVTSDRESYRITGKHCIVLDRNKKFTIWVRQIFYGSYRRNVREDSSEFITELQDLWQKTCSDISNTPKIKTIIKTKKKEKN
jgi:hypothetical protein